MHIQRNIMKRGKKVYKSILLRESYYDKGKRRKRTLAILTHLPEYLINQIEIALKKEEEISYRVKDLEFTDGYSIGHIASLFLLVSEIGVDKMIYSKGVKERDLSLMMIIGRILYPSSKLENTRWIKREKEAFSHFFHIDYEKLKVDDLYKTLDWLEKRKGKIEKKLYRGRGKPTLFLYDITSTYFEGKKADLSALGFNRDKKKGKRQVVIGLTVDKEGYPLSVEVFRGNTSDQKTVKPKMEEIKKEYGIETAVLVGDRGMITEARMKDLEEGGFKFISCLTHKRMEELIKDSKSPFQLGLFDKKTNVEIEYEGRRYILYKSEIREKEEGKELASLLRKTRKKLFEIRRQVKRGKLKDKVKIGKRVGRWKNKYKVGKYFITEIDEGKFRYYLDKEELELSKKLLGCYVVVTNLSSDDFSKEKIVEHYKSLSLVERAFRTIKTTLLNIRPIYHWKERRIRAHAFICMLSYYLVVEMKKRLKELFDENGKGRDYALTFQDVLEELRNIKVGVFKIKDIAIKKLKPINPLQRKILERLKIEMELKSRH